MEALIVAWPSLSTLTTITVILGTLHIIAALKQHVWGVCLTKPAAMLCIIAIAAGQPWSFAYRGVILAGLALSLCGDIFLMLPRERFLAGLSSFFLAHILYCVAFLRADASLDPVVCLVILLAASVYVRLLWAHLNEMKIPVVFYVFIIGMMGALAISWALSSPSVAAQYAGMGAFLFMISDIFLAWRKFRSDFPSAPLWYMATYFAAQWCIAVSCLSG